MFKSITVSKVSKLTARVSGTIVTLKYDRNSISGKVFYKNINNSFAGTARNVLYFEELRKVISYDNICILV